MSPKQRAIFLDRDGVINDVVDRGDDFFALGKKVRWTAPWHYSEFSLKHGMLETVQAIRNAGYLAILITNQPDVGYGFMQPADFDLIMADIRKLPFDDIYVCTHGRDEGCDCKKPKPGMLLEAANKWGIDFSESFMVGDTKSDLEVGRAVGCKVVIIDHEQNKKLEPDYRMQHLKDIEQILKKY